MGNHSKCLKCGELDEFCACAAPVGHSAATDEQQDHVLPPTRGTDSQHSGAADDFGFAVMKNLGPEALTGGKMSPFRAFELGWNAGIESAGRFRAQGGNTSNDSGNSNIVEGHSAATAEPTVTRLDVLSLIREQCHCSYIAGATNDEVDTKYMAEIESAIARLTAPPTASGGGAPKDCATVCRAAALDGIACPNESCDIEDGTRDNPTASGGGADLSDRLKEVKWRIENMLARDLGEASVRDAHEAAVILDAALAAVRPAPTEALQLALYALKKAPDLYACGFNARHAPENGTPDETGVTAAQYEAAAEEIRNAVSKARDAVRAAVAGVRPAQADEALRLDNAVNRFFGWKLPKDFQPDCGITFKHNETWGAYPNNWPIGTNLLTADQARAMFEYCLREKP